MALVLGAKMARMQVQIERRALKKKKSPLYDIVCSTQVIFSHLIFLDLSIEDRY